MITKLVEITNINKYVKRRNSKEYTRQLTLVPNIYFTVLGEAGNIPHYVRWTKWGRFFKITPARKGPGTYKLTGYNTGSFTATIPTEIVKSEKTKGGDIVYWYVGYNQANSKWSILLSFKGVK